MLTHAITDNLLIVKQDDHVVYSLKVPDSVRIRSKKIDFAKDAYTEYEITNGSNVTKLKINNHCFEVTTTVHDKLDGAQIWINDFVGKIIKTEYDRGEVVSSFEKTPTTQVHTQYMLKGYIKQSTTHDNNGRVKNEKIIFHNGQIVFHEQDLTRIENDQEIHTIRTSSKSLDNHVKQTLVQKIGGIVQYQEEQTIYPNDALKKMSIYDRDLGYTYTRGYDEKGFINLDQQSYNDGRIIDNLKRKRYTTVIGFLVVSLASLGLNTCHSKHANQQFVKDAYINQHAIHSK